MKVWVVYDLHSCECCGPSLSIKAVFESEKEADEYAEKNKLESHYEAVPFYPKIRQTVDRQQ
jgi:hypothetical protein